MPCDTDAALFWTVLGLTIAGGLLSIGATVLVATRSLRDRKQTRAKFIRGQEILLAAAGAIDAATTVDEKRTIKARRNEDFESATGRSLLTYNDTMMIPELTAMAITDAQIDELKLPAALLALGIVISTTGSVLSLWV